MMLQEYSSFQQKLGSPSIGEKRQRSMVSDQAAASDEIGENKDNTTKDSKDFTDPGFEVSNCVDTTKGNEDKDPDKAHQGKVACSLESSQGRDSSVNSWTSLANVAAIMRNGKDNDDK